MILPNAEVTSAVKGVETTKLRSEARRGAARRRLREESEIGRRRERLDARRFAGRMRLDLRRKRRHGRVHRHDAQWAMEPVGVGVAGCFRMLETRLRAAEARDPRARTRRP